VAHRGLIANFEVGGPVMILEREDGTANGTDVIRGPDSVLLPPVTTDLSPLQCTCHHRRCQGPPHSGVKGARRQWSEIHRSGMGARQRWVGMCNATGGQSGDLQLRGGGARVSTVRAPYLCNERQKRELVLQQKGQLSDPSTSIFLGSFTSSTCGGRSEGGHASGEAWLRRASRG